MAATKWPPDAASQQRLVARLSHVGRVLSHLASLSPVESGPEQMASRLSPLIVGCLLEQQQSDSSLLDSPVDGAPPEAAWIGKLLCVFESWLVTSEQLEHTWLLRDLLHDVRTRVKRQPEHTLAYLGPVALQLVLAMIRYLPAQAAAAAALTRDTLEDMARLVEAMLIDALQAGITSGLAPMHSLARSVLALMDHALSHGPNLPIQIWAGLRGVLSIFFSSTYGGTRNALLRGMLAFVCIEDTTPAVVIKLLTHTDRHMQLEGAKLLQILLQKKMPTQDNTAPGQAILCTVLAQEQQALASVIQNGLAVLSGAARKSEGASAEERPRHTFKAVRSPFLPCATRLSQVPASWPAMRAAGAMRLGVAMLKAGTDIECASDMRFSILDQGITLAMHVAADPDFKLDASIDPEPLRNLFATVHGASDSVLATLSAARMHLLDQDDFLVKSGLGVEGLLLTWRALDNWPLRGRLARVLVKVALRPGAVEHFSKVPGIWARLAVMHKQTLVATEAAGSMASHENYACRHLTMVLNELARKCDDALQMFGALNLVGQLAAALSMALDHQAAQAKQQRNTRAEVLSFTGQLGCDIGELSALLWRLMKPADYDSDLSEDVVMRLGTALLMLPREIAPEGMCQARPELSSEPPPKPAMDFLRGPGTACCLLAGGIANHPGIAGSFTSVACWQSAVEVFETLATIATTFDLEGVPCFNSIGPPQLVHNMLRHYIRLRRRELGLRRRELGLPLVRLVGSLTKALLKGVCGLGRHHWRVHMGFFCKILAAAGELLRQEPDESAAGIAFSVAVSSMGNALNNLLQNASNIRARMLQMSELVGYDAAENVQVVLGDLISSLHRLLRHIGSRSAAIQASLQDLHKTYKVHNPDVQALLKLEDRQVLEALLERIRGLATAEDTASAGGDTLLHAAAAETAGLTEEQSSQAGEGASAGAGAATDTASRETAPGEQAASSRAAGPSGLTAGKATPLSSMAADSGRMPAEGASGTAEAAQLTDNRLATAASPGAADEVAGKFPRVQEMLEQMLAGRLAPMLSEGGVFVACSELLDRCITSFSVSRQHSDSPLPWPPAGDAPPEAAFAQRSELALLASFDSWLGEMAAGKQRLVYELCQELEVASAMIVQESASPDMALQIMLLSLQTVTALLRGIPAFRSKAAAPTIVGALQEMFTLHADVLRCIPAGSQLDAKPVASLVRGILLLLRDSMCGQFSLHADITDKFVGFLQSLIERSPNEALSTYRGVQALICCEDATPALIKGMLAASDTAWMVPGFLTRLLTPHATQDDVHRSQAQLCAALVRPEFDLVPILLEHVQTPVADTGSGPRLDFKMWPVVCHLGRCAEAHQALRTSGVFEKAFSFLRSAANLSAPTVVEAYSMTLQLVAQMAADPEVLEADSAAAIANINTLFAALRRPHGADRDAAIAALALVLEYETAACDVLTYQALQPPLLSPIKGLLDAWGSASNSWQLRAAIAKCLGNLAASEGGVAALAQVHHAWAKLAAMQKDVLAAPESELSARISMSTCVAQCALHAEAARDAFRARGAHKLMAAELLQALDQLWAEAIPDLNDIPVLSFKTSIGTHIVALASALDLLIRPADYKDTSSRLQEAVTRLAYALLKQPNDALEIDAEKWAAGVRSPELDNGAIGYTSRMETLCQLVEHGLSHCEAMAVPFANDNYVRAAYRLFYIADRLARHFGDDERGRRLRTHVYSAAALVNATLVLYKGHNINSDIPPHKLVDTLRHNNVDLLEPVMRTDFAEEVGTVPWHWQMRIGCKLLGLFGELATSWPLLRDTLYAVTSLLGKLPQLPLPGAGADQPPASVRAANERVRDVAGDLVVALDKTMRQLSTRKYHQLEVVEIVMSPLFAPYNVNTKKRLLRPEAQKLLDVWLQPFRDEAGAVAAAEAAAAALLREEEAAARETKKNKKKAKKKSKQSGQVQAECSESASATPARAEDASLEPVSTAAEEAHPSSSAMVKPDSTAAEPPANADEAHLAEAASLAPAAPHSAADSSSSPAPPKRQGSSAKGDAPPVAESLGSKFDRVTVIEPAAETSKQRRARAHARRQAEAAAAAAASRQGPASQQVAASQRGGGAVSVAAPSPVRSGLGRAQTSTVSMASTSSTAEASRTLPNRPGPPQHGSVSSPTRAQPGRPVGTAPAHAAVNVVSKLQPTSAAQVAPDTGRQASHRPSQHADGELEGLMQQLLPGGSSTPDAPPPPLQHRPQPSAASPPSRGVSYDPLQTTLGNNGSPGMAVTRPQPAALATSAAMAPRPQPSLSAARAAAGNMLATAGCSVGSGSEHGGQTSGDARTGQQTAGPAGSQLAAHEQRLQASVTGSAPAAGPALPSGAAAGQAWHLQINIEELECPITQVIMTDPVMAADGHTYERTALEEWFSRKETSPMTGLVLDSKHVIPNIALRRLIQSYTAAQQAGHANQCRPKCFG